MYSQIKLSDLRPLNAVIEGGQWSVVAVFDQNEFHLNLVPGWVKEGASLALDQAYAIVTPTWTLMLSDFDNLCVLLMGGAALHPDSEIKLRLLIALAIHIQKVLGVVHCEIVPVKDQAELSALWLSELGQGICDSVHYRCAAELQHGNRIVSGFMALLVSRSDPRKIFSTVNQDFYQFKRLPPNLNSASKVDGVSKNEIPLVLPITLGAIDIPFEPGMTENGALIEGALFAFISTHLDDSGKWTFPMEDFNLNIELGSDKPDILTLESSAESPLTRLADIPQHLEVRLGHITLTYADLLALKQGQAIRITGLAFPKVKLFSMNQCVAVGELVSCDDQVYVQILDVASRGQHEQL